MTCFGRAALRRVACLLPLILLFVLCASCSDFWVSNSSTASVTLSPGVILKAGDTSQLSVFAKTVGGTTTDITSSATWTSSNPAVVTVVAGKLTVIGSPAADTTVVITAKSGGQSATCNVLTYTGATPTTIAVNFPSTLSPSSLATGTRFKVNATAALSGNGTHDISNYVTWSSNSTNLATVDANGNVTVLTTIGTFTITANATFASGSVSGTSTSFVVI